MPALYKKINKNDILPDQDILSSSGINLKFLGNYITIKIPFPCTDGLYYKKNPGFIEISDDIRLLYEGEELDPPAVMSCFYLGAPVPPLTIFKGIQSFLPGFDYEIDPGTLKIRSYCDMNWSAPGQDDFRLTNDEQQHRMAAFLDTYLQKICPDKNPLILFSGGVDSALLALRASMMGWNRTSLVHFSFGKDDNETKIARKIAAALELSLDIIPWNPTEGFNCLENAAMIYRQPFCDIATVASYQMVTKIMERYPKNRMILEGLAADSLFGRFVMVKNFSKLYTIPKPVRHLLSDCYRRLNMWKNPQMLEYYFRLIRRTANFSLPASYRGLNPLMNIAYTASAESMNLIDRLFRDWIGAVAGTSQTEKLLPMANVAFTCAANQTEKATAPLIRNGYQIKFPFINKPIMDFALNHVRHWPDNGRTIPKRHFKTMLATSVPSDLVYRQKRGFLVPMEEQFSYPVLLEHLNAASSNQAPLFDYVDQVFLKQLLVQLKNKKKLPFQTYNFAWALAFNHAWLSQLRQNKPSADGR